MRAWVLLFLYECGHFVSRQHTPQHEHSTIPSGEVPVYSQHGLIISPDVFIKKF